MLRVDVLIMADQFTYHKRSGLSSLLRHSSPASTGGSFAEFQYKMPYRCHVRITYKQNAEVYTFFIINAKVLTDEHH